MPKTRSPSVNESSCDKVSASTRNESVKAFVYTGLPMRVVFGAGTLQQLSGEVSRLGVKRALILTTPPQEDQGEAIKSLLGERAVGIYAGAEMHTPVTVTEDAMQKVQSLDADCIVSVGGGSTIGLGKAIALRTSLPLLAVPTTYAGSEMTTILGQTEDGVKTTLRDLAVLPKTVIYDVDLTMTLPPALSGTSGINAIAHAVEALYAKDANPMLSTFAEQGIAALARSLPFIKRNPHDASARYDALYGAWLCGVCLGSSDVALHHKLCHVLGGSFDLPHAETHTILLPHAVAYNAPAIPDALAQIERAMERNDAAGALFDLATAVGAKTALSDIGMPEDGIDKAAEIALQNPYFNPRPITQDGIRDLLTNAFHGRRPTAH